MTNFFLRLPGSLTNPPLRRKMICHDRRGATFEFYFCLFGLFWRSNFKGKNFFFCLFYLFWRSNFKGKNSNLYFCLFDLFSLLDILQLQDCASSFTVKKAWLEKNCKTTNFWPTSFPWIVGLKNWDFFGNCFIYSIQLDKEMMMVATMLIV